MDIENAVVPFLVFNKAVPVACFAAPKSTKVNALSLRR
jgi:hypothetical protein